MFDSGSDSMIECLPLSMRYYNEDMQHQLSGLDDSKVYFMSKLNQFMHFIVAPILNLIQN